MNELLFIFDISLLVLGQFGKYLLNTLPCSQDVCGSLGFLFQATPANHDQAQVQGQEDTQREKRLWRGRGGIA